MDSPPVPLPLVKSPPWHMNCVMMLFTRHENNSRKTREKHTKYTRNAKRHAPVEAGALEVKGLALAAHALLAGAEGAEVLGGLRDDVRVQLRR